jgi:serine/threonine protein kinase
MEHSLDPLWGTIRKDYKLVEQLGKGSYGEVLKAVHRETKQHVAIKLMKNIFSDSYQARKTLREIKILRKLSRIPNNLYTTNLKDVILPNEKELLMSI